MFSDGNSARLASLARQWNQIERKAKKAEHFRGEAIVASVNEMRYAGRRIVDVLDICSNSTKPDQTEIDEHLVIAKNYLINADHDLVDSICFFVLKKISRTVDHYSAEKVKRLCPLYAQNCEIVSQASQIVQGSRETRIQRMADYTRLEDEYLPILMSIYDIFTNDVRLATIDPAAQELRDLRSKVNWIRVLSIVSSIASIASLLLGIAFWVLTWSDFRDGVLKALHNKPAIGQQSGSEAPLIVPP